MINMKSFGSIAKTQIVRNAPTILTAAAIASGVAGAVFSAKGHILARDIVECEGLEDVTPYERLKSTWKCYAPAAACVTAMAAFAVASHYVSLKRLAGVSALCTSLEAATRKYRGTVLSNVGEEAYKKIEDQYVSARADETPKTAQHDIVRAGQGDTLFYDDLSGRYFYSDVEAIRSAQNLFNKELIELAPKTLNEFYSLIGLEHIALGDYTGWNADDLMDINFATKLTEDGEDPCIVIDHSFSQPKHDYDRHF